MAHRPFYKSRWFQFLTGLLVTIACLAWALYSMKSGKPWREMFEEIGSAFRQADYRTLLFLWVMLAVFYWLKAHRWKLLLAPVGDFDATRDLLPPIMAGFAGNNLLPARMGEFIRVWLLSRKQQVPVSTALASVAVERILDALTLLVLLGLGVSQLKYIDPNVSQVLRSGSIAIGAAAVCILAYLVWTRQFIRLTGWFVRRVPLLPEPFGEKIIGILETGSLGLTALKRGRLLGGIVATSLAQWALNALYLICALRAFGIQLNWDGALVLMGVVAFGVAVPSVPGYFGVMQFYFLLVLRNTLLISGEERIFAASIYYQLSQFVPVTLIGVICANRMGFGLGDAGARAAETSSGASDSEAEASN